MTKQSMLASHWNSFVGVFDEVSTRPPCHLPNYSLQSIDIDGFTRNDVQQATVATIIDGLVNPAVATDDTQEMFVEQRLDHFDRQQSKTFKQRYFINKK